jgi:O-antigen/teichoic acid export membrane protein
MEGSFAQNLAISFSGNAMAQVLGFAFTPFIARIYGPEAYGVFALCMAIISNLHPLSTLQLPSGYVAAENDKEFYSLIKITLMVLLGSVICISTVLVFFGDGFIQTFQIQELQGYLYIIPVYLFFMGIDSIFLGWSIRLKEFKLGAWAKMLSIVSSKTATLLMGIFTVPSATGIILGNLLLYPIDNLVKMLGGIKTNFRKVFSSVSPQYVLATLKKFKSYPLYITPGLIINNLSVQLPIYYFSIYFLPADIGFFAMAGTLVSTPLNIIITSSTSVFLQKAAETKQSDPNTLGSLSLFLYKRLFFVGVIPLSLLAIISTW